MLESNSNKSKLMVEALPDSPKNLKTFGVGGGIILLVIYCISAYSHKTLNHHVYIPVLAAFFIITGLKFHAILRPIFKAWMFIAIRIGHVVTLTILFILFIFVFAPLGWLRKKCNSSGLSLDFNPNSVTTYWIDHEKITDKSRYLKEF